MYIRVKVTPGSKKETCVKISESEYVITVREKAERNMANNRVIERIAHEIHRDSKDVRIISGHHSRTKLLSVRD